MGMFVGVRSFRFARLLCRASSGRFEGLVSAKEKEIAAATEAIESKTARAGELAVKLVSLKNDLSDAQDSLADDTKCALPQLPHLTATFLVWNMEEIPDGARSARNRRVNPSALAVPCSSACSVSPAPSWQGTSRSSRSSARTTTASTLGE